MIRQWLFGGTDVEFEKSLNFYAGWRENILPYSYAPQCVTPGVTARGRSISISSITLYQLYEYIYMHKCSKAMYTGINAQNLRVAGRSRYDI